MANQDEGSLPPQFDAKSLVHFCAHLGQVLTKFDEDALLAAAETQAQGAGKEAKIQKPPKSKKNLTRKEKEAERVKERERRREAERERKAVQRKKQADERKLQRKQQQEEREKAQKEKEKRQRAEKEKARKDLEQKHRDDKERKEKEAKQRREQEKKKEKARKQKEKEAKLRREAAAKEKARKQKEKEAELKKKKAEEEADAEKEKESSPDAPSSRRASVTDMINKFESISKHKEEESQENAKDHFEGHHNHEHDAHESGSHHQSHAHKNHNKKSQEARRQHKKYNKHHNRDDEAAEEEEEEAGEGTTGKERKASASPRQDQQHQHQTDESLQISLSPIDLSVSTGAHAVREGEDANSEGGERRQSVQDLIDSFENILNASSPLADVQITNSTDLQSDNLITHVNNDAESDDGVDDEVRDADHSIDELRGMMPFDVSESDSGTAHESGLNNNTPIGNQEEDRQWNERRRRSTLVVRDTGGGGGLFGEDSDGDAQSVPEHWQEFLDPVSGNTFWHNMQTGVSQWEPPAESKEEEGAFNAAATQQQGSNNDVDTSDGGSDADGNDGIQGGEQVIEVNDADMQDNDGGMTADQWRNRRRSSIAHQGWNVGDWTAYTDPETDTVFWFHAETGESTWDRPQVGGGQSDGQKAGGTETEDAERECEARADLIEVAEEINEEEEEEEDDDDDEEEEEEGKAEEVQSAPDFNSSVVLEWQVLVDPKTEKIFYHNAATGENRWELPPVDVNRESERAAAKKRAEEEEKKKMEAEKLRKQAQKDENDRHKREEEEKQRKEEEARRKEEERQREEKRRTEFIKEQEEKAKRQLELELDWAAQRKKEREEKEEKDEILKKDPGLDFVNHWNNVLDSQAFDVELDTETDTERVAALWSNSLTEPSTNKVVVRHEDTTIYGLNMSGKDSENILLEDYAEVKSDTGEHKPKNQAKLQHQEQQHESGHENQEAQLKLLLQMSEIEKKAEALEIGSKMEEEKLHENQRVLEAEARIKERERARKIENAKFKKAKKNKNKRRRKRKAQEDDPDGEKDADKSEERKKNYQGYDIAAFSLNTAGDAYHFNDADQSADDIKVITSWNRTITKKERLRRQENNENRRMRELLRGRGDKISPDNKSKKARTENGNGWNMEGEDKRGRSRGRKYGEGKGNERKKKNRSLSVKDSRDGRNRACLKNQHAYEIGYNWLVSFIAVLALFFLILIPFESPTNYNHRFALDPPVDTLSRIPEETGIHFNNRMVRENQKEDRVNLYDDIGMINGQTKEEKQLLERERGRERERAMNKARESESENNSKVLYTLSVEVDGEKVDIHFKEGDTHTQISEEFCAFIKQPGSSDCIMKIISGLDLEKKRFEAATTAAAVAPETTVPKMDMSTQDLMVKLRDHTLDALEREAIEDELSRRYDELYSTSA